ITARRTRNTKRDPSGNSARSLRTFVASKGPMSMKKTMKTFALFASGLLILSGTVIVVNQTAQVVQLAKTVNPFFGTVTLWGLLLAYGGMLGVPVVMVMRMPRPLSPPASEEGAEFQEHLTRLGERLATNPRVLQAGIKPSDRRSVEQALWLLDEEANLV